MISVKHSSTKYLVFLSGWVLIGLIFFAIKFPFVYNAQKTTGIVHKNYVHGINKSDFGSTVSASVVFETTDSIYTFLGPEGQIMNEGELVPVMYDKQNPHVAYINTFDGYWLNDLIWCLLPAIFWLAISLSVIEVKKIS